MLIIGDTMVKTYRHSPQETCDLQRQTSEEVMKCKALCATVAQDAVAGHRQGTQERSSKL